MTGRSQPLLAVGMSEVVQGYDAFLVDVWGVLHDGIATYPGVIACLQHLRAAGKKVVLLSNVGRTASTLVDDLLKLGIGRDLYDHPVTSGESTRAALRERADPRHARLGRRCLILGPDPAPLLDGLGLELVEAVADAEFILAARTPKPGTLETAFDDLLAAAAQRHLPMVCANPDLVAMVGGTRVVCPGAFARRYQSFGGAVLYHGKPHAPIYEWAIRQLGIADRRRICGVGDALRTDVAGAAAAGLDSVLVGTGVHADEIGTTWPPAESTITALLAGSPYRPDAIIPGFRW